MPDVQFRMVEVETWRVLAERFYDGEERPEWAQGTDGAGHVGLTHSDDEVRVVFEVLCTRDDVSVQVQLIARYDFKTDDEKLTSGEALLGALTPDQKTGITRKGMRDLTPFVREVIYNASAKLRPDCPIMLTGRPNLDPPEPEPTSTQNS